MMIMQLYSVFKYIKFSTLLYSSTFHFL